MTFSSTIVISVTKISGCFKCAKHALSTLLIKIISLNFAGCPQDLKFVVYILALKMAFDIVSHNGGNQQYTWLFANIDNMATMDNENHDICDNLKSISKRLKKKWGIFSYYTNSLAEVYATFPQIIMNAPYIVAYWLSKEDAEFVCEMDLGSNIKFLTKGNK